MPKDTKLPLLPTHTKFQERPSMSSHVDQRQAHMEAMDMLQTVEE